MKACDTCKVVIDEDAAFCPRCGRPALSEVASDPVLRVHKLLTDANLHRIRGGYDAAIDHCTEALRLQPADAEVHSMLGDVYESLGKLEEAARWYQMAIELRTDSAVDAAKLERIRSRLKKIRRGQPDITTGSWARAALEESRAEMGQRKIVLISVAVVLTFIAFGAVAWVLRMRAGNSGPRVIIQPAPHIRPSNESHTLPPPTTPGTNPLVSGSNPETLARPIAEQQILSSLATNLAISTRHLMVEDVKQDPRTAALIVTFRLPEPAAPLTRIAALRHAVAVAGAAFTASPEATTVTVRALASFEGKLSAREPHLVLICDASRQVSGLDADQASSEQLHQFITNLWWGPELPQ